MDSILRYEKILSELRNQVLSMQPKTLTELKQCLEKVRGDLDELRRYLAGSSSIDKDQLQEFMKSLKALDELLKKDIEKVSEQQDVAASDYRRGLVKEKERLEAKRKNDSGLLSSLNFFKLSKK